MARLHQLWVDIKGSFWFLPTLIVIFLTLYAIGIVELDKYLEISKRELPIPWSTFDLDSVRTFLATIAGSMMTIAGVIFSITILVLSQTSGQYTSRVLRSFMKNRANQMILGIFVGIFVFCLFSITILHAEDNALTAISGLTLAVVGVGFLVHYIHQISLSIQATEILRNIYLETAQTIDTIFEKEPVKASMTVPLGEYTLPVKEVGFLRGVDKDNLLELAKEYDVEIQLRHYLGDFLPLDDTLCYTSKDLTNEEKFIAALNNSLIVGKFRTSEADPLYGFQQIVDIALRGLSPTTNDLTTAQTAIGYLSSLYAQLINCHFSDSVCLEGQKPLLTLPTPTFDLFLEKGFGMLFHEARRRPPVRKQLTVSMERLKHLAQDPERKKILESALAHLNGNQTTSSEVWG